MPQLALHTGRGKLSTLSSTNQHLLDSKLAARRAPASRSSLQQVVEGALRRTAALMAWRGEPQRR